MPRYPKRNRKARKKKSQRRYERTSLGGSDVNDFERNKRMVLNGETYRAWSGYR